jgi:hypothetical protein
VMHSPEDGVTDGVSGPSELGRVDKVPQSVTLARLCSVVGGACQAVLQRVRAVVIV